jgi:cytochrome c556
MMLPMSRILILFAICTAVVSAQDESAYSALMKSVPPQVNAIKAAIMAKDNAAVATEANKLAATFQEVSDFWTKQKKDDAVKMAQATRDAAKEIAAAKDADSQNAAVTKAQGTCGACHRVYREGTPGNFKIKS